MNRATRLRLAPTAWPVHPRRRRGAHNGGSLRIGLALALLVPRLALAATAALIIDDLGYNRERARRALALPPPVAVSIIPDTPYADVIARGSRRAGIDMLIHLPMEANRRTHEPHVLRRNMGDASLRAGVAHALAELPGAIGINNHEGSALTRDRHAMDTIMDEIARDHRRRLFVDSRTTAASRAEKAARDAGVPSTHRNVFLDNRDNTEAIEARVHQWLAQAQRTGCSLAIGHPHPATLRVLARVLAQPMPSVERVDLRTYIQRCGH